MSEDQTMPPMTPEQKENLRFKIEDLEKLEQKIAEGEVAGTEAENLLDQSMAEIEAILAEAKAMAAESVHAQSAVNEAQEIESAIENEPSESEENLDELILLKAKSSTFAEKVAEEKQAHTDKEKNTLDQSLDQVDMQLKQQAAESQREHQPKAVKTHSSKRKKTTSKKKLKVPTKVPRSTKKKAFPTAKVAAIFVFAVLAFFYKDILNFIQQQQAELAEKNKPVLEVKKDKPKPKPKPIKIERSIEKVIEEKIEEEPQNFFQPKETNVFTGELVHYSFNQVLKDKCVTCHGADGKEVEGDFNIALLMRSRSSNSKAWAKVYRSIDKGEMPPPKEDYEESEALIGEEKELLMASIKDMFDNLKEGIATRVMTPYELENTMNDLFDIDVSMYNPFKTMHQTYSKESFYTHQRKVLSPYYISQYYNILYDVLQSFIGLRPQVDKMDVKIALPGSVYAAKAFNDETHIRWPQRKPKLHTSFNFEDKTERKATKQDRYIDGNDNDLVNSVLAKRTLPPGTYKLTFKASLENMSMSKITKKKYGEEVVNIFEQYLDQNQNFSMPLHFHLEPPDYADPFARGKFLETIEISSEGEYGIEFTLRRRAALACNTTAKLPGQTQLANLISYHKHGDKHENKTMQIEMKNLSQKRYDFPMIKISELKIDGPYNVQLNPLSFKQDEKLNSDVEIREKFRYLHGFNGMKLNVIYTYLFRDFQKDKMKYEDAYRNAMIMFFMSPKFLILNSEPKTSEQKVRYLSYAAHKSAPSDEFSKFYSTAKKRKDAEEMGKWLIEHERFPRFVKAFAYQWLKLGIIEQNQPDTGKYKEYYRSNLADAQALEAEFYLMNMFRDNRPVRELVDSDYSFWNQTLESFYTGSHQSEEGSDPQMFVKRDAKNSQRGGILTMGSFLTATGNGVDPLPLRRAAWISENILDSPLPSPPNVDVNEFENQRSGKSLRERLAVHAENPACNSCHKRLDSLAILMDKFDSIGGYNDHYNPEVVKVNGTKINDVEALKQYLGEYEKPMARAFTRKLISFMMGREVGVKDEAVLDAILKATAADGYRVGDLYGQVIKYYLF
jgi:hypothetical protein